MRKIINATYITLDGAVENPHLWPSLGSNGSNEGFEIQNELLHACDVVLMGRRTYDSFAAVWPKRSGDPYTDRINAMKKVVASSTLRHPEWNNTTIIGGDIAGAIERLKAEPGKDIVQYGLGPVSFALMAKGLIDEFRLWMPSDDSGQQRTGFAALPCMRHDEVPAPGRQGAGQRNRHPDVRATHELNIVQVASVILGRGEPLFPRRLTSPPLTLDSINRFGEGFAELRYRVPKLAEGLSR